MNKLEKDLKVLEIAITAYDSYKKNEVLQKAFKNIKQVILKNEEEK